MSAAADEVRPLAWARIGFGVIFLLSTTALASLANQTLPRPGAPLLSGWPTADWHASAFGASIPASLVCGLCIVRTLAALAFLLGWHTRPAGLVAGASGFVVMFQDGFGLTFTQHLLFEGTMLLALVDSSCVLAVRPDAPRSPRSSLALVRVFLASIYVWAAFAKMRPDWLDGRTLGLFYEGGRLRGPLADALLSSVETRAIVARSVVVTELVLAPLLLIPRTRWVGIGLGVALHVGLEVTARPEAIGWLMCALLLACVKAPVQGSQTTEVAGHTISP